MKVKLTGKRKGNTETLCGVDFVDGVGTLNREQISVHVFENLLERYYAVIPFNKKEVKPKASTKAKQDAAEPKVDADITAEGVE